MFDVAEHRWLCDPGSGRGGLMNADPVRWHWKAVACAAAIGTLLAACGAIPGVGPADPGSIPDFGASNETKLDIGLFVNGQLVAKLSPGQSIDKTTTRMPPLPWSVEARSATGRVLGSTSVEPGGATCTPVEGGTERCTGALILVTLVCGRFEFFAGTVPSIPAPAPGVGEPCDP
jgi:hypothetical protein